MFVKFIIELSSLNKTGLENQIRIDFSDFIFPFLVFNGQFEKLYQTIEGFFVIGLFHVENCDKTLSLLLYLQIYCAPSFTVGKIF